MASRGRRFLRVALWVAAVAVVVEALFGARGLSAMLDARRQHAAVAQEVARLRDENARLRQEARRLREDPEAIEEIARGELGLIAPGEKLFRIRDLPAPSPRPAPRSTPPERR